MYITYKTWSCAPVSGGEQYHVEIVGQTTERVHPNFVRVLGSQPVLKSLLLLTHQLNMLPERTPRLHKILHQNVNLKADFTRVTSYQLGNATSKS